MGRSILPRAEFHRPPDLDQEAERFEGARTSEGQLTVIIKIGGGLPQLTVASRQ